MDQATAHQFALAIAAANGHPDAEEWAKSVADHFASIANAEVAAAPASIPAQTPAV